MERHRLRPGRECQARARRSYRWWSPRGASGAARRRLFSCSARFSRSGGRCGSTESTKLHRPANENSRWGYTQIQGALHNLGHRVARSTIAKILRGHGIEPAPDRPSSWRTFLAAHWGSIAAADFFTTEVWTRRGLVTYDTLFVIDLASRRVPPRSRTSPLGLWTSGDLHDQLSL